MLLEGLPGGFTSPGWTAHTLSAWLHRKDGPAPWTCNWPSSELTPAGPHPSYAGGSRCGHSILGEVSQEWRKGRESPPLTCGSHFCGRSPRCSWLSGLQIHIAGLLIASCQTTFPSPSSPGCSQSILCSACICAQDCPNPEPYTRPCCSWGHRLTSQASQSLWVASLTAGVLTTPHGLVSLANVLRVLPLITSPIKTLKSARIKKCLHLDLELLRPTLWVQTSSLFFIHPSNPRLLV